MTDQELRDVMASLAVKHVELAESQRETARVLRESGQETDRRLQETDRQLQETDRQLQETDRQLRNLGRQIGGLGDKFGSFTEGLALPSMSKILTHRFGMEVIAPRTRVRDNGHSMEIDVLAYSRSRNEAFVVEVKSHLREDALDQMRKIFRNFRDAFPEHADKKVYGILAAVDGSEEAREKVLREGIYLASIHDGQFDLQVPDGFEPRAF